MIETIAFYVFGVILVASAAAVVISRNPVHSVLFLILAFFNAAGLFVLLGAEFVAMILVIVYVGAVAVLFLFVVMMLDINFRELRSGMNRLLPFGIFLGLVLGIELIFLLFGNWVGPSPAAAAAPALPVTNTRALGQLLYTHYLYVFQAAGLILLVAMVGAIVLTLRQRVGVRKQDVSAQVAVKASERIRIVKMPAATREAAP